MFFARRKKSIERKRIFANVSVNQQSDFSMQLAERGERGKWHSDQIAHSANIDHHLVGAFIGKPAAKLSNHRSPVLPLSLRPSTRRRDSGYGRKKGTTPFLVSESDSPRLIRHIERFLAAGISELRSSRKFRSFEF